MFKLFLISLCITLTFSIELTLKDRTTCLEYEVEDIGNKFLFSYHVNPQIDQVNMIIYDKHTTILNQTGHDHNYHNFLQVQFIQTGLYPICFEKFSQKIATVQFDIISEQQKMLTAGKEDINKLSKKISQFLIDIRKTGWEFKQILEHQNEMKIRLTQNEASNYWTFAAKMGLMVVILLIQFYAVKYIFQ